MTPTLRGRRQTRLFLFAWVGLPLTIPFACISFGLAYPMLVVVLLVGLLLDPVYDRMQQKRWDHDWPTHLQVKVGLLEGFISFVIFAVPFVPLGFFAPMPFWAALVIFPLLHYPIVWGVSFLLAQGPLRVVLPRWRYRGGETR